MTEAHPAHSTGGASQDFPIEARGKSNQNVIVQRSEVYSRCSRLKFRKTPRAEHERSDIESFNSGKTHRIYVGSLAKAERFFDQYPSEWH